jgi:hypothetical protein
VRRSGNGQITLRQLLAHQVGLFAHHQPVMGQLRQGTKYKLAQRLSAGRASSRDDRAYFGARWSCGMLTVAVAVVLLPAASVAE